MVYIIWYNRILRDVLHEKDQLHKKILWNKKRLELAKEYVQIFVKFFETFLNFWILQFFEKSKNVSEHFMKIHTYFLVNSKHFLSYKIFS